MDSLTEGDLIIGTGRSAIGTLVERKSRSTLLVHLPRLEGWGDAPPVKNGPALSGYGAVAMNAALTASLAQLPAQLRQSLTWDRGKELAGHAQLTLDTGTKVISHADRGCQYTSAQLAAVADELNVRLSERRSGVCWDNAQQESFWSTLKTEFYQRHEFATRAEAIHAVSTWIDTVYNNRRRHSALGQIPPVAFEHRIITAVNQAALTDVHETESTPGSGRPGDRIDGRNARSAAHCRRTPLGFVSFCLATPRLLDRGVATTD